VITVLAGGVGASRFLRGLIDVADPERITVISNTGDDVEIFGLHVSPDTDIVLYALADAVDPDRGWGLAGDTFAVVDQLQRFGYQRWFNLGDRDLATSLHRTRLLREGVPLHEVTGALAEAWKLRCTVLPMTDSRVSTVIESADGPIPFQDYMVRLGTDADVRAIRFDGLESARPAPGVLEALSEAEIIVIAPSNPFVSVGPILAVPGVREALAESPARRVAVTPIVAGDVIKGPAAKMLRSLGHEVSALGVARIYRDLIDLFVLDEQDAELAPAIRALGLECLVTDTIMSTPERKAALAQAVLEAAAR